MLGRTPADLSRLPSGRGAVMVSRRRIRILLCFLFLRFTGEVAIAS